MWTLTRTTAMAVVTRRRTTRRTTTEIMTKTTKMPAIGSLHCPASYSNTLDMMNALTDG